MCITRRGHQFWRCSKHPKQDPYFGGPHHHTFNRCRSCTCTVLEEIHVLEQRGAHFLLCRDGLQYCMLPFMKGTIFVYTTGIVHIMGFENQHLEQQEHLPDFYLWVPWSMYLLESEATGMADDCCNDNWYLASNGVRSLRTLKTSRWYWCLISNKSRPAISQLATGPYFIVRSGDCLIYFFVHWSSHTQALVLLLHSSYIYNISILYISFCSNRLLGATIVLEHPVYHWAMIGGRAMYKSHDLEPCQLKRHIFHFVNSWSFL